MAEERAATTFGLTSTADVYTIAILPKPTGVRNQHGTLVAMLLIAVGFFNCCKNLLPVSQILLTQQQEAAVAAANFTSVDPSSADNTTVSTTRLTKVVDIISIGSLVKPSFQDAQQRTFGSHTTVRNFFRITENDDTDRDCSTQLTMRQFRDVVKFCKKTPQRESLVHNEMRTQIFNPTHHTGWLCAQKRPIDGLHKVLQMYARQDEKLPIPEWLFIIDDDTYMNMDLLVDMLWSAYPTTDAQVRAGCTFENVRETVFPFPYGGFGSYLSKRSIERLLQPINCSSDSSLDSGDAFTRLACWRLQLNHFDEANLFRDGMRVIDLMHAFSSHQPYRSVSNWTTGYCLHSDHALAYFINFYHIGVPEDKLRDMVEPNDNLRQQHGFKAITTEKGPYVSTGECKFVRENCTADNIVCHYIQPQQMDALSDERLQRRMDAAVDMEH